MFLYVRFGLSVVRSIFSSCASPLPFFYQGCLIPQIQSGRTGNTAKWPNVETALKNRNRKKSCISKRTVEVRKHTYKGFPVLHAGVFHKGPAQKSRSRAINCNPYVISRTENLVPVFRMPTFYALYNRRLPAVALPALAEAVPRVGLQGTRLRRRHPPMPISWRT